MSIILILAFLFYVGSMLGWVLELFFRRMITKNHKWVNPGFLIGPYLPLYGFGLCILYLLAMIETSIPIQNDIARKAVLFFVMACMMTLIEYIAGIIFIKRMKVKLWDYTDEFGNIGGIICPKYSLCWALLGAVYYFVIHPHILEMLNWLAQNLAFSFFVGFFYGIFIIDFIYSARLMTKIRQYAEENKIVIRLEEFKMSIRQNALEKRKRIKFIFALNPDGAISEHLRKYHETRKKIESDVKKMIKRK